MSEYSPQTNDPCWDAFLVYNLALIYTLNDVPKCAFNQHGLFDNYNLVTMYPVTHQNGFWG